MLSDRAFSPDTGQSKPSALPAPADGEKGTASLESRRFHDVSAGRLTPVGHSESPDRSSSEAGARIARALEARRAASLTVGIPGYWLLDSPGMTGVVEMARRLARAPGAPVLIEAARGSGMLELARVIHDADPIARMGRLRTMTASLIGPSETRARPPKGTFLIEGVESLRPAAQSWIAELLASRTDSPHPVRIIGASQKSTKELLCHDGLSQELVLALDVGRLVIPPLRNRPNDILKLARRFLRHYAAWRDRPFLRFSEAAERKLIAHTYPANVQELRNLVERAAALATSDEVGEEAIVVSESAGLPSASSDFRRPRATASGEGVAYLPTLAEMERNYLVMLIRELKGRRTVISRAMGVSYPTVLRKISLHGLDVKAIVGTARTSPDAAE